MHYVRKGSGKPLLLIHGLGQSWRSWGPVLDGLAERREVIAVDLPGFGATPALSGETSIATLSDAVTDFLRSHGLLGIDAVGSSMGARLVLELARRGRVLGGVVSLDPGGFWRGWEKHYLYGTLYLSVRVVRLLQPVMPAMTQRALGRTLLLSQLSPRPWRIAPRLALEEMRSYAAATRFDELLYSLVYGATQQGAPKGAIEHPLVIGWGRRDRVCFPRQAYRAVEAFPDARLHWFDGCGHFPHWDNPQESIRLILATMGGRTISAAQTEQRAGGVAAAFQPREQGT